MLERFQIQPNFLRSNRFASQTLAQLPHCTVNPLAPLQTLPRFLHLPVTLIIAKGYVGQTTFAFPSIVYVVWVLMMLSIGTGLSCFSIKAEGLSLLLLPLGWLFTLHGARLLRLTLQHAASHNAVFRSHRANFVLGTVSSIITWTTDFRTFKRDHLNTHHDHRKLMTSGDETYEFWVTDLRVKLGMPVQKSLVLIIWSLISPAFHAKRFLSRLKNCFLSPYILHNLAACLGWGIILATITLTGTWRYFVLSWMLPMSVLFECCSVLRQCVEHRWPVRGDNCMTGAIRLADLPPQLSDQPSKLAYCIQWCNWWLRLVLIHLPIRLLVLPGDSPNHHRHHAVPGDKEWSNHIFKPDQNTDFYPENWGLFNAIHDTLTTLSLQNSAES